MCSDLRPRNETLWLSTQDIVHRMPQSYASTWRNWSSRLTHCEKVANRSIVSFRTVYPIFSVNQSQWSVFKMTFNFGEKHWRFQRRTTQSFRSKTDGEKTFCRLFTKTMPIVSMKFSHNPDVTEQCTQRTSNWSHVLPKFCNLFMKGEKFRAREDDVSTDHFRFWYIRTVWMELNCEFFSYIVHFSSMKGRWRLHFFRNICVKAPIYRVTFGLRRKVASSN